MDYMDHWGKRLFNKTSGSYSKSLSFYYYALRQSVYGGGGAQFQPSPWGWYALRSKILSKEGEERKCKRGGGAF